MTDCLVSIIIPLFNREAFITETLKSLQDQTFDNWEAVVVDDGSTDASVNVVEAIAVTDTRVRLIKRYRTPKGGPTCRNIGIEKAQGDYVVFLDSDDLLAPFCLQQRVAYMEAHKDLGFSVFMGQLFHNAIGDSPYLINIPSEEPDLLRFLNQNTPWLISNPIWRRSALQELRWVESISCYQDYLFHIQALLTGIPYKWVIAEPDCFWRRGEYETISKTNQSLDRIKSVKKVVDYISDALQQQSKLEKYKVHLQSSYIDVIHRALNYNEKAYTHSLITELFQKHILTKRQRIYLDGYVKSYIFLKSSFSRKALKRIMCILIGKKLFYKQYGTFVRIKRTEYYT